MDVDELGRSLTSAKLEFDAIKDGIKKLEGSERQAALESELDRVSRLNDVLRSVIKAIDTAQGNVQQIIQTAQDTDKVLDRWVAIMSQTEHTYQLLRNPQWQGASKDLEVQAEKARQRELERQRQQQLQREAEERALREAEQQKIKRERDEVRNRRIYGSRRAASSSTATAGSGVSIDSALASRTQRSIQAAAARTASAGSTGVRPQSRIASSSKARPTSQPATQRPPSAGLQRQTHGTATSAATHRGNASSRVPSSSRLRQPTASAATTRREASVPTKR
jgi:hypothetical protein